MRRSHLIEIIRKEIQSILKEESTQYNFAGILITNTSTEDGRPQKDIRF